jgi:hypothetical protein
MMHVGPKAFSFIQIIAVGLLGCTGTQAQTISGSMTIALKNGESAEVTELWSASNCRSLLKGTIQAEVVDGPPGISVAVKPAMVIPRAQNCAKPIPGGKLVITANEIEDVSYTPLTIRITYPTRDGDHKTKSGY